MGIYKPFVEIFCDSDECEEVFKPRTQRLSEAMAQAYNENWAYVQVLTSSRYPKLYRDGFWFCPNCNHKLFDTLHAGIRKGGAES